jgi:hypothetical protein
MEKKTIFFIGDNAITIDGENVNYFLKGFTKVKEEQRANAKIYTLTENNVTTNKEKEFADVLLNPEDCPKEELVKWFKAMANITLDSYKENTLMKRMVYTVIKEEKKRLK